MLNKLFLSTAFAGATVLSVASVFGSANVANAATFGFSFSNVNGAVNGIVEGTIELPDGDGTFAATSVFVTSAPAALGYTTPFDVLANFPSVNANSFTVAGGTIDALNSSFLARSATEALVLNFPGVGTFLNVVGTASTLSGVNDSNSSTLTYSAVPEPLTILGAGAAISFGTAFKRKLAQKKNKAA
ncbi:PEP-CTERM sorting domain-containing protein [Crocosphaera sp. UHCC 0190]|uniref:PEP-CTERM sorting domain-containing protein n=1 Tax=Crocosphaera sp. UHCC 0190 TaxID=3110246 RepID=UPI002B1EE8B4|nr:PEP-CTERM sorting domain-containing protein [Crocosphaera sp. UHCC 0190]MEA5508410.1 PEP-CTERM sorting domain-containing protein [Crocosphaera sp. UHCC 0190]